MRSNTVINSFITGICCYLDISICLCEKMGGGAALKSVCEIIPMNRSSYSARGVNGPVWKHSVGRGSWQLPPFLGLRGTNRAKKV